MSKVSLIALFTLGFLYFSSAQSMSENALGLRLGDNKGFGAEISYQRALSNVNRLELDLGWRSGKNLNGFKLTGIYQWLWGLDTNFNFYAGAGGGIGSYGIKYYDEYRNYYRDYNSFLFIAGDAGIEYNFDFPLLVSLNARPEIGFSDYYRGLAIDIALAIRYQF